MNFQTRVGRWVAACFGLQVLNDKQERNHRFLEEALELVQAADCTKEDAHQLVEYVFSRPKGEVGLEAGGVMVCLAALCSAHDIGLEYCADDELERVWHLIDKIRTKWQNKPKVGPLPSQENL